jgi:hypothetical protein
VTVAQGQTQFQMRYGSSFRDDSRKVIQTQDGNYLIVGTTNGFGSLGNALIMKVNASGNILWTKDYSGINGEIIFDVIELSDKKLVMCGKTGSFGSGAEDGFIIKTDSLGNVIWAKVYGDIGWESFVKISKDGSDGFYVAGNTYDLNTHIFSSIILRTNSLGNIIWMKYINDYISMGNDVDMKSISSGGVILAERVSNNSGFSLYKFSLSGNLLWSNKYTPSPAGSGLLGLSILEKTNGEIVVSFAHANINTPAQSYDIFIVTLNSSGVLISDKSYGGIYSDNVGTIANTNDGGIIICGATDSAGNGDWDACLIKLSPTDSVQWAKAYGTVWREESVNAVQTSDQGFVFSGLTYSIGNQPDSCKVYLVKTDTIGNATCHSISWTPIMNNQTLTVGTAFTPLDHTFQEGQFNWALNNRYFYTVNICNPSSVETIFRSTINLNIYPNPFSEQTTLQTDIPLSKATLSLYNYFGQIVAQIENINGQTVVLNRDNLASGLYFARLTQDNQVVATVKLVVVDN